MGIKAKKKRVGQRRSETDNVEREQKMEKEAPETAGEKRAREIWEMYLYGKPQRGGGMAA